MWQDDHPGPPDRTEEDRNAGGGSIRNTRGGISMQEIEDWYIANTGYVLQLATPYYEELTVHENLTLATQIKLHSKYTTREQDGSAQESGC